MIDYEQVPLSTQGYSSKMKKKRALMRSSCLTFPQRKKKLMTVYLNGEIREKKTDALIL